MLYKDFQGEELSALGFGLMRLPVVDGDNAKIDQAAVNQMVDYALDQGVNYFDTAWAYHGGCSEAATGEALRRHPRDTYNVATKFPGYDAANAGKVAQIFEQQLARTGLDYFDFYLFHNVAEKDIDIYLDPAYGILDFLLEQKHTGRIRHLGFSTHGSLECMRRFLDAYGQYMEFCQIQLNYFDWEFQNARAKVDLLASYGIPVWVMEPVRGGKLVNLDAAYEKTLRDLRPGASNAEWCFRFVQSVPGVVVTLSGMSNMEQMEQNIATFSEDKPLSAAEFTALQDIAHQMGSRGTVPCTACRYCTEYCPRDLDIPKLLEMYNQNLSTGPKDFISRMYLDSLPAEKRPQACVACGRCAKVCPQGIDIPAMLADFAVRAAE